MGGGISNSAWCVKNSSEWLQVSLRILLPEGGCPLQSFTFQPGDYIPHLGPLGRILQGLKLELDKALVHKAYGGLRIPIIAKRWGNTGFITWCGNCRRRSYHGRNPIDWRSRRYQGEKNLQNLLYASLLSFISLAASCQTPESSLHIRWSFLSRVYGLKILSGPQVLISGEVWTKQKALDAKSNTW